MMITMMIKMTDVDENDKLTPINWRGLIKAYQ